MDLSFNCARYKGQKGHYFTLFTSFSTSKYSISSVINFGPRLDRYLMIVMKKIDTRKSPDILMISIMFFYCPETNVSLIQFFFRFKKLNLILFQIYINRNLIYTIIYISFFTSHFT